MPAPPPPSATRPPMPPPPRWSSTCDVSSSEPSSNRTLPPRDRHPAKHRRAQEGEEIREVHVEAVRDPGYRQSRVDHTSVRGRSPVLRASSRAGLRCVRRRRSGYTRTMRIGSSIGLIALDLILALAVSVNVRGIDLTLVGWILTAVGLLGLLVSLALTWRNRSIAACRDQYGLGADPY